MLVEDALGVAKSLGARIGIAGGVVRFGESGVTGSWFRIAN
jgi:hypothetical protein